VLDLDEEIYVMYLLWRIDYEDELELQRKSVMSLYFSPLPSSSTVIPVFLVLPWKLRNYAELAPNAPSC
jgi:hypothetical protein